MQKNKDLDISDVILSFPGVILPWRGRLANCFAIVLEEGARAGEIANFRPHSKRNAANDNRIKMHER